MTVLDKIVATMRATMPDDQRLSEIQDHLTIAGCDVPLRGYDVTLDRAFAAAKELRAEMTQNTGAMWSQGEGYCWCPLGLGMRGSEPTRHGASCERKRKLLAATAWLEDR